MSGFSGQGGTGTGFDIGAIVWGSATFNPTAFVLQSATTNATGNSTLLSAINLNGADRTIRSEQTSGTTGSGTFSGIISNSTGTAGLIKDGVGHLVLSNASNSYNGSTTITQGILTANSTGALGDSSATNTLIFNGGTLRAGGTITSVAARGVTMTQTGIIDTNNQAVSIAGNIGGTGGLTKNGAGTLTLSGTNNYGGVTTVNAGTLQFANEVSPAGNTAANLNVKNGATLALNVGGAGQFTSASLDTLLSNISVANTAAQGLQAGAILALDTTGGTFTQGNAIANSTGASGGGIGLTKLGTGTLILDKPNTYTGLTTITAGTLQLNAGGVIAAPVINNATFAVNSPGAVTQGTHFGLISGTGAVTNTGAGTLTLNLANTYSGLTAATGGTIALTNGLAIQNSPLVTTSGTTTYSGGGALTIGGLSGATGDLGSGNVLNGYTGLVTALTLNPQSGSVTYGGVISDGSGAMSLTKTGAGTQILTGANTYTGHTIVNAGTLTIGVNGSLSSSSTLQINGGTFSYGNTAAGLTLNGLIVRAGNANLSNTATGQTLALGTINRTDSAFGTVNFPTLAGPVSTITGNVNSIIGPWATTGSGSTLSYAVGSPDGISATNITPFSGTTATANTLANVSDATLNYEYSAAVAAMPASTALTGNTLRYSGAATTTTINATSTLTLNGLMQAGTGLLTISGGPTTGGILIGSTGELVINANTQGTTISAAIRGTGRLVYNGAGSRLLLSSTTSNYSGGTVINSGQLAVASDAALGLSTGSITLNGGSLVGNSTNPQAGNGGGVNITSAREVIVGAAGGAIAVHGNNNFATSGRLSGAGTLTHLELGGGGGRTLNFNSTSNYFTGRVVIQSNSNIFSVNSLVDTAGSGNIALNLGAVNNGSTFAYGFGAIAPLTLDNRAIELNASGAFSATIQNNNTTHAISIGSNLIATGTGAKTLALGAVAGPMNVFPGNITDGIGGGTIGVTKTGVGTWILSGTGNSYTSGTNIIAGSLGIGHNSALGSGTLNLGGTNANTPALFASGASRTIPNPAVLLATTTGNPTISGTQALTINGPMTASGGPRILSVNNSALTTLAGNVFLSDDNTTAGRGLTINGTGTTVVSGVIANNSAGNTLAAILTKAGAGTLELTNTNTYTGATTVSGGKLLVNGQLGNTAVSVTGTATLGGSGVLLSTLSLAGTSFLEVNLADPLQVNGTITFGSGFGIANITGFDWDSVALDSPLTLLATTQSFSSAGIANFGPANAVAVGALGRTAYFQNGSLAAVVVPETGAISLLGLATLATLRRRRTMLPISQGTPLLSKS